MSPVRLAGIRVVVFDLDDTLYAERDFAFSGFEAVGAWLRERRECPFDPVRRMRELFETAHRPRVFDRLLEELGEPSPQDWVQQMVQRYREHRPSIRLLPDAEAALARWSGQFRLAMITDGPETTQRRKIEALELAGRLNPMILTDQWGATYGKPHPRAFLHVETVCQVRGAGCVYLADNPQKDFIAPRRLGWQSVRVRRPGGIYAQAEPPPEGRADQEVGTLAELELHP